MIWPPAVASDLSAFGRWGSLGASISEGVSGVRSRGRRGAGHAYAGSAIAGSEWANSVVAGGRDPGHVGAQRRALEMLLRGAGL